MRHQLTLIRLLVDGRVMIRFSRNKDKENQKSDKVLPNNIRCENDSLISILLSP